MFIGIPKEIKNNENRVGMTPSGVAEFVRRGHTVFVQHTAGEGSGFSDEAYTKAGARILPAIEDVYQQAKSSRGMQILQSIDGRSDRAGGSVG